MAEARKNETVSRESEPFKREEQPTVLSFESLTLPANMAKPIKTPECVREIVKLQKSEAQFANIQPQKEQVKGQTNGTAIDKHTKEPAIKMAEEQSVNEGQTKQPAEKEEPITFIDKTKSFSRDISATKSPSVKTNTPRSIQRTGSSDSVKLKQNSKSTNIAKNKPDSPYKQPSSAGSERGSTSKTPTNSRNQQITFPKSPDMVLKQKNKTESGKSSFTPRSRNTTNKIQLSPIKSQTSASRSSNQTRSMTSTSMSIDLPEREPTKDFDGLTCTPCENQDVFHEAFYWCRDCNEALCDSCSDHHKSLRMSKAHKLIKISEADEMPFTLQVKEHCSFHKHKKYEFFCSEHEVSICAQCVTTTHKFCSDVLTIDDAAQKAASFTDMRIISEKLKEWSHSVEKLQTQRARNVRELDLQRASIEKEIQKFRDDLVKHFDDMKQKSLDELSEVYSKNLKEIQRQSKALKERQDSLGDMQKNIKMMQNYASQQQVFLGTRELKEKQAMEAQLLKVFEGQFNLISLEFVVTNFMDLPLKVDKFGIVRSNMKPLALSLDIKFDKIDTKKPIQPQTTITTMPSKIVLKAKRTFSVEKGGDYNFIRGGTILPDGRTILVDHNNKCLSVFSPKGTILDKLTFYSCPWDVAALDPDSIALTIPDKKEIVIMETKKLQLLQQIKVNNSCFGIAPIEGRIVVVCEKTGFLILDRAGTVAATLKCDVSGVKYVVAAFGNLYYTDFIRKTVNCMNMTGNVVFRFQNENLKHPGGITAIRDEFILVTGYNSKNVIAISADGKYHEVVLSFKDGLMYPTAIDYCHESSTLMLCSNRRGTIEIYDMT